jgi:uncharacterized membrane protein (DUF106 family)
MAIEVVMLLVYTVILSLVIAILYKILTNQTEADNIKEEMKYFKDKIDEAKKNGDTSKMNQHTTDMLKVSSKQFKITMKPMIASMFVFLIVLGWFGGVFANLVIPTPFAGYELNWFWWYLVITIPATMIFRKLMGVM